MPNINVVIPVLNGERTIRSTLESLVSQTYQDFNVLVVDDGSTDDTLEVVNQFRSSLDLCILSSGKTGGVADALNMGVSRCNGEYIARIDADDIAHPRRFEYQKNYMDSNPSLDVCGTAMAVFTEEEGVRSYHYVLSHPKENESIKTAFLERCAVSHPSLLLRPSVFDRIGFYDPSYAYAEDYELWCRGAKKGIKYCNLEQVLTHYRKHTSQVSATKSIDQYRNDIRVKKNFIESMIETSTSEETAILLSLRTVLENGQISIDLYESVLRDLISLGKQVEDVGEFARIVSRLTKRCFDQSAPKNLTT
jgi:GT2 family glycosyltransferase